MATFVTGLEGFVGQHLLGALPDHFFPAFGTALADPPKTETARRATYQRLNIQDFEALKDCLAEARASRIVHLAAQANVGASIRDPLPTLQTNIEGTLNLLEAARLVCPKARILFISSSEVYGGRSSPDDAPFVESDPVDPPSPYAASKLAAETVALSYARTYGMDVRVTRSFNHTGPGQSERFIFSHVAKTLAEVGLGIRKEPSIQLGELSLYRDYLDVRDVASAYVKVLESGGSREIYNVASGKARSLREMVDHLVEISGLDVQLVFDLQRKRSVEIPAVIGSSQKLCDATGWEPEFSLEDTFRDLLKAWRESLPAGQVS